MLRFATPLVFGALGGVISERSGVVNIGLEGMMLDGRVLRDLRRGPARRLVAGLLLGMVAGGALALIHAFFAITLRADQIVSGFAVNFLALGTHRLRLPPPLRRGGHAGRPARRSPTSRCRSTGSRSSGRRWRSSTCWSGSRSSCVPLMSMFLFRTPTGLRVRSVGENPRAAATVGISVYWIRYLAVIASGMLAAMGGAFLSHRLRALVQPEHDRGPRVHRAGGRDRRQVAAGRGTRGGAAVRLHAGAGAAAGRCSARARRRCCRRCRTS